MARLVDLGGAPANDHEREVVALLQRQLPGAYTLIPNVSLPEPRTGHAYEYDVIVVAPHAVYVAELKGWRGRIREQNRSTWVLRGGKRVANPLPLTDNKARILKSLLSKADLDGPAPYVQACFICGDDDTELDLFGADAKRSLHPGDAARYFGDPGRLGNRAVLSPSKSRHKQIVEAITGPMQSRRAERVYGSYRCTDLQAHDDESATWLAQHALLDDGRAYRVRTWYLSPYRYDEEARAERVRVLRRTADALSRIGDHPNVATLRDFGLQEGEFFEVLDWSDAGTLVDAYARGTLTRMPVASRLQILRDIAAGLGAALEAGVVHRALSPEAVLLTPDGRARLTGFDRAFVDARNLGTVAGAVDAIHPSWLAPEVRAADGDLFDNTDLYSLGRMGLEMFGDDLPEGVTELLRRCLAEATEHRPEDPSAFVAALDAATTPPKPPVGPPADPTPRTFATGDLIDGTNAVVDVLARGPGSTVYAVINQPLGETFALKVIDEAPDGYDPLREFQLLHRLDSAHVLRARWTGALADGRTYLLLDHVEGPTLRDRIDQGDISADEALLLADQLLDGLEAVARAGHVHRDIKPENVVVGPQGAVLVDFSSAAPLAEAGSRPVGTLRYAPPDLDQHGWSTAADTFSAACVIFELVAGAPPWGDEAPSADVAPLSLATQRRDLPEGLTRILQRAVSPTASLRYESPAALRRALADAARGQREAAQRPRTLTHLGAFLDDAGTALWGAARMQSLARHADLLVPVALGLDACVVMPADDDPEALEAALLASEAKAHAFEAPLPVALPSLYDQLVEGRPPADLSQPDDADGTAARQPFGEGDRMILFEGLHFTEVPTLVARAMAAGRTVARYAAAAGPIDPRHPDAAHHAADALFTHAVPPLEAGDDVGKLFAAGARIVSVRLADGERARTRLGPLMAERRARIERVVDAALDAPGRVWIGAAWNVVYLGSGLRLDVGAGLDASGDATRALWAQAFPTGRCGADGDKPLRARLRRPTRTADGLRMPIGRLAWPDPPGTPWLQSGGASLCERLLPLLRVDSRGPS